MKKLKFTSLALLGLVGALALTSCGGDSNQEVPGPVESSNPESKPETNPESKPESKPELKEFKLTLADKSVTYDGEPHSLEVAGEIPEGTVVEYSEAELVNAGVYTITMNASKEGYKDLSLTAKLTINKADFSGITFEDLKVEYDGNPHKILISGNLPEGSKVTYSSDNAMTNEFTKAGEYRVTAVVENPNFNTLTLTAKLNIEAKLNDRLHSIVSNGVLYFQNALDDNSLYAYMLDGTIKKISNSKSEYFTVFDNNIYFRADSLLQPTISKLNPDTNKIETAFGVNAKELQSDGAYIYYIVNNLTGEENGIYRFSYDNNGEPKAERLYEGKASNLALIGNRLYFSDLSHDKYLSYINTTNLNQTPTVLKEEKISSIYTNSNELYFTVKKLSGSFIMKYSPATNSFVKLTSDAAGSMVVIGDYLYYTNDDKVNTLFGFGKGIYRVKKNVTGNSNAKGEAVLKDGNEKYELDSLQANGNTLYFYRVYDKSIYSYDINSNTITNLLDGFVKPEETPLFQSGKALEYKDKIYFQNIYDNNTLYSYDGTNTIRLTSTAVDEMFIYNDYLYYRQVSYLVNKDLYRINLKTSDEPKLISKDDCGELLINDNKIYYVNYSGSNTVNRMDLDGSNNEVLLDFEAYSLKINNNRLYFIKNGVAGDYLHYMDLNDLSKAPVKLGECKTTSYEILGNEIYFRKIFKVNKCLAKVDLDGNNYTELLKDCDPKNIVIENKELYYYNDVAKDYGIYKYNLDTKRNELVCKEYASNLILHDGYIYYYNYTTGVFGNSHFNRINLASKKIERIA